MKWRTAKRYLRGWTLDGTGRQREMTVLHCAGRVVVSIQYRASQQCGGGVTAKLRRLGRWSTGKPVAVAVDGADHEDAVGSAIEAAAEAGMLL